MTDEVTEAAANANQGIGQQRADLTGAGDLQKPLGDSHPAELAKPDAQPDPMQKAIEGGYKEEPQPSREDRAAAVVAELEHAIAHNAPVTLAALKEIRELLEVPAPDDTPVAQVAEVQA